MQNCAFGGLFGTVWSIYHALIGIGMSGIPTVDKVTGPVGEALIMTAFGLAVAIPAVLGYNALNRGNKVVIGKLNRFAFELHGYFHTGACVRSIPRPANDGVMRFAAPLVHPRGSHESTTVPRDHADGAQHERSRGPSFGDAGQAQL
ncbi:hypothetical protein CO2235_MP10256 [Cupriavidus oxalaticus]|uniref:Biopolymer transport protein ExbB n=1 Tax=Cupriavidus oxalaticus TaxID=96344 RepID=A0A375FL98_9BURK|nr:hypothetical protein CO2235_U1010175 [Cupriavidus oxalaticus]SPC17937.1 hypothetical protein CO2235_MP10256 [Cupriavidus oxalaticus]